MSFADNSEKPGSRPDSRAIDAAEREALLRGLGAMPRVLLAVSGGADSMALMHLAADWRDAAPDSRPAIQVVTVDHRLREEAAAEARWVADQAEKRGLAHAILEWRDAKPRTGLQDAAREARYRLLSDFARKGGHAAIVTAHHADDQAETVLMRLMRGSGVDGLAGIPALGARAGMALHRPFLGLSKARLVATLEAASRDWIEDPSNEDARFERVRVRRALGDLAGLGLTSAKLGLSARRAGRAAEALDWATSEIAGEIVRVDTCGYCEIDRTRLADLPEEIALRLLGRVLSAVGGGARFRLARCESLLSALCGEEAHDATLAGCLVRSRGGGVSVYREPGRRGLPEIALPLGEPSTWDGRFEVCAASGANVPIRVRALGQADARRLVAEGDPAVGPPLEAAAALPAFFTADRLVSVPQLNIHGGTSPEFGGTIVRCTARFATGGRIAAGRANLAKGLQDPIF